MMDYFKGVVENIEAIRNEFGYYFDEEEEQNERKPKERKPIKSSDSDIGPESDYELESRYGKLTFIDP